MLTSHIFRPVFAAFVYAHAHATVFFLLLLFFYGFRAVFGQWPPIFFPQHSLLTGVAFHFRSCTKTTTSLLLATARLNLAYLTDLPPPKRCLVTF